MGPAGLLRAQAGSLDVGGPLGRGTRARNPGVRLAGGPGRTQPNQAAEEGGTEAYMCQLTHVKLSMCQLTHVTHLHVSADT